MHVFTNVPSNASKKLLVLVLKQTKLQYKVMNGFLQDKLKNMVLLLPNGNIFVGY